MSKYPFREIERKWQAYWADSRQNEIDLTDAENKLYALVMFIYPSGDRLHIGHWYNYGPTDTWARFKKMQGFRVLEPIGYDAFGLPAENYAIEKGVHPAASTAENIKTIREQLKAIGTMYDWSKEIDTSSPEYYKWTQWLFLQLYKNGLAYRNKAPVNWCPNCSTVLANEQVIDGHCERCDNQVTRRDLEQWFFKITDYAEKLLEAHKRIDWPEKTIAMQRNWIGRSKGALITFRIPDHGKTLEVFTTRPDTLFGATYMVLAPEHHLVDVVTAEENREEIKKYVDFARGRSDIERTSLEKEKTGAFTGAYAINPVNDERIPIWIADYVLSTYGTGAVMAVPAHDQRDFEFAKRFDLPIRQVISPDGKPSVDHIDAAATDPGIMINSGGFNGLTSEGGSEKIIEFLDEKGWGRAHVNYRLRDWLISRQRYWGAPIPIIYCSKCGEVAVPESDLPVLLPEKVDFSGKGQSPLKTVPDFLHTKCPECGAEAKREVDTMDTFVCSSWYFLRYVSPKLDSKPWEKELTDKWLPVDQYVGGAEHAVMHLLYARFITKVLCDLKFITFDEPFKKLIHQGTITNKGTKMSKSRNNVVNPERFIAQFGSDTFRMYMMFMGSYEDGGDWSDEGISGMYRFLNRVSRLVDEFVIRAPTGSESKEFEEVERIRHYTIKTVTEDLERFQFNTAISRLMEFFNAISRYRNEVSVEDQYNKGLMIALDTFIRLLAPFAPQFAEELWERRGNEPSIFERDWPDYDENVLKLDHITMVVQVNGKLRDQIIVDAGLPDDSVIERALQSGKISKYVSGKEIVKKIVVPQKLVNFVVK